LSDEVEKQKKVLEDMAEEENTIKPAWYNGGVVHVDNKHVPVMFFFHLPPHKSDIKAGR